MLNIFTSPKKSGTNIDDGHILQSMYSSSFCYLLSRNMSIKIYKIKILPPNVSLCVTFSVALKEEQILTTFWKRMLRKGIIREGAN